MIFLIIIFICGIVAIEANINEFNDNESSICPRFLCNQSPCTSETGNNTAYRYDGDKLICQGYVMDPNFIL